MLDDMSDVTMLCSSTAAAVDVMNSLTADKSRKARLSNHERSALPNLSIDKNIIGMLIPQNPDCTNHTSR